MVSPRMLGCFTDCAKTLNLAKSMKGYSLRLTFGFAVIALGILMSCTAQTARPSTLSEVNDRHNLRDEQEGAPRVDNAPIDR